MRRNKNLIWSDIYSVYSVYSVYFLFSVKKRPTKNTYQVNIDIYYLIHAFLNKINSNNTEDGTKNIV